MHAKRLAPLFASLLILMLCATVAEARYAPEHDQDQEKNQSTITNVVATTAATSQVESVINRVTAITAPGGQGGTASGDGPLGLGVWGMGGGVYLDGSKKDARYDGSFSAAMLGVDKQWGDLLFGVAFGAESLDLTTKYNSGKILSDGFSVTPYLGYAIKKDLVADASFSFTSLDYTMKNTQGVTKFSDHMGGQRMTTAAGLTQYLPLDKLLLSGRIGLMYLDEHQGSYNLSATIFSPADVYGLLATATVTGVYDLGAWKPSLGLNYEQALLKSGGQHDTWGVDLLPGVTYSATDRLQLGLNAVLGVRENLTKAGGVLSLRYDF